MHGMQNISVRGVAQAQEGKCHTSLSCITPSFSFSGICIYLEENAGDAERKLKEMTERNWCEFGEEST